MALHLQQRRGAVEWDQRISTESSLILNAVNPHTRNVPRQQFIRNVEDLQQQQLQRRQQQRRGAVEWDQTISTESSLILNAVNPPTRDVPRQQLIRHVEDLQQQQLQRQQQLLRRRQEQQQLLLLLQQQRQLLLRQEQQQPWNPPSRDVPRQQFIRNVEDLLQQQQHFSFERIKIQGGSELATCPICLVDFSIASEAIRLANPCGHTYHENCIVEWLKRSNTCPMCRRPVM